jgi:L,D-peptidoglycan transpeptidase YkuD (ErfK/YbiS/YcfS/YnhG family)
MQIILKNKDTLLFDEFQFKCCIGKKGISKNKIEGDKKTPTGNFSIGSLFYRNDRNKKPKTKLKIIKIKKNIGWCDDVNSKKYNKLVRISKRYKYEKFFRNDFRYDYIIPILYNYKKVIKNKGSAIFIHLTNNYRKKTLGCIALKKNDFLILLKIINKKTKIRIG